jgi:predicted ATPase
MLKSFSVKNFRLFRSLHVQDLGQLNLLVGKNNTGKSAFLEAVRLFVEDASPHLLWDLVTSREESRRGRVEARGGEEVGSPIRHLFPGHRLPELGEEGIVLVSGEQGERLHITTAAYRSRFDEEEGAQRPTRVEPAEADLTDPEIELFLVARNGDRTQRLMRIDESARPRRAARLPFSGTGRKAEVVPPRGMPTNDVAVLWDKISLTPLEEEVVQGIELIDESIEDIAFVEDPRAGMRIPLVRTRKFDEPVPLSSMGDGVSRLFEIILALVSVKGGVLLVDEFENGLHWSIQPQVWSTVFKLAATLNVQVFATTHSRDCVEAFHSAWQDKPELGAFFRLSLDPSGEVRPVAYDLETLADSVATRVEVR